MATDLTVALRNEPGTLATLGEAVGTAGINLEGVCGVEAGGQADVHVLVDDAAVARQAFESAGLEVRDEREVLVVDIDDRPGELGRVARRIADAGANINLVYLATNTRLVIGADDLGAARSAVGQ